MKFLSYLWQLPQNLLGLLLIALYKPERKHVMDNGNEIHFATRCSVVLSVALSLLMAYLSHYFELLLLMLNRLHERLWERIDRSNSSSPNRRIRSCRKR